MSIERLEITPIWEAGKTWQDWLATNCGAPSRAEMEQIYGDVTLTREQRDGLQRLAKPVHILALAEDWCGDVRRNIPVVARVCAENAAQLRLRLVDKESNEPLMSRYLTNGAEAIPIVIFLSDHFVETGYWGPRPAECKRIMARGKASGLMDRARQKITEFYAQDRHVSAVREIIDLIEIAAAREP
ncbi:MAG: thioredoxin family protein [Planctomycetota bacterium]